MALELFGKVLTGDGGFEGEDDAPILVFAGLPELCFKQKLLLSGPDPLLSIPLDPLARAQGLVGLPPGMAVTLIVPCSALEHGDHQLG